LAAGETHDNIITDFPKLKEEHIFAALNFAANREQVIKILAA